MENSNSWQKVRSLMDLKDIPIRDSRRKHVVSAAVSSAVSGGNVFVPCCLQKHRSQS